jgi:hypothetical protein
LFPTHAFLGDIQTINMGMAITNLTEELGENLVEHPGPNNALCTDKFLHSHNNT